MFREAISWFGSSFDASGLTTPGLFYLMIYLLSALSRIIFLSFNPKVCSVHIFWLRITAYIIWVINKEIYKRDENYAVWMNSLCSLKNYDWKKHRNAKRWKQIVKGVTVNMIFRKLFILNLSLCDPCLLMLQSARYNFQTFIWIPWILPLCSRLLTVRYYAGTVIRNGEQPAGRKFSSSDVKR